MLIYQRLKDTNLILNLGNVCCLAGATQKGYHLCDLQKVKIIHSRDVVFDETSTPGMQKETLVKYVQLQVNDESTEEPNEPRCLPDTQIRPVN